MKQLCKRSLAALLLLVMLVGYFSGITIRVNAASYTYNWGTREDVADQTDFARSTAEEWYAAEGTSYEELCQYTGSSTVSSVTSSTLYQQLRSLMRGAVTDTTSYEDIKTLCKYTDCQNGGGSISSFYSGNSVGPSWDGTWNREHTWPDSKGDANGSGENDIFMLRPTSYAENGSRGNTAYGEGSSYYNPNEESGGTYDLRGDVARIILFVYVRWQDYTSSSAVLYGTSGVIESRAVLLKWMEEDPVDTWELGRNDSCQSITGTRNVFVDYPELAFLMLGDEIPDNYTSPSGVGSAVSYNITAQSNNTSYGTVSVSGKTITATPKTGYYASGYTVTSGTATVTQNGNVFTVSASSDCTIRINFAAKASYTVTYMAAGKQYTTKTAYGGDVISLASYTGTVPEGYTFAGWVSSAVSETTSKPANIYAAGGSYTVTGNATLYALFTYSEGGSGESQYVLTDLADIGADDPTVITVTASNGTVYAMTNNNGTSKAPTGDTTVTVSSDGKTLTSEPADTLKWNVGGSADAYIFYPNGDTSTWLYCTSTNNGVRVGTTAANTFKIDSTTGYLVHNGTGRYIGVYTTNPDWRCYTTNGGNIANQTLRFYSLQEVGTVYYTTNPVQCNHGNTENVAAVAATCTQSGYTAGVYCNDCDTYISGYEVVDALGHSYDDGIITTDPTCTAAGVMTFTCTVCGDSYTEAVASNGHSYGPWEITKEPTCTAAGSQLSICFNCGGSKTQSVPALGHSYIPTVTPPTATEQGYTTFTCELCGDSYTGEAVYIVKFSVPSGVTAVANMNCGANGITLPTAGVPTGEYEYVFAGWVAAAADNTTEKPEILAAGTTYNATANVTLYALYTYKIADGNGASDEFTLYSGELTEGDYVIVYGSNAMVAADANNNTRIDNTAVTVADDAIQAPDATIIWHIAPDGDYWTIYNEENAVYAAGNGSKNKATVISDLTDYGRWTATGDGTYEFKNLGNANKSVNANLRYNDGVGFGCYSTSTGGALSLYKAGAGSTTYYTTVIGEEEKVVESWNISLGDNIAVNFVLNVDEADEVSFSVAGEAVTAVENGNTYSIYLAAAQMTDEIVISVNGTAVEDTYSVREYADVILTGAYDADAQNLVKAMLCYGGAAQTYFDYNASSLASSGIEFTAAVPTGETEVAVTDNLDGLDFYGASVVHENKTAVRFYFTGSIEGLTFSQGTAQQKGEMYYIEVAQINPYEIGEEIEITVTDGSGNTLVVGYSPLTYIVRMYEKAESSAQTKALVLALYNYYLAAENYLYG